MQVIVDGLLTHYERSGGRSAKTVLILPGWADSSASWMPVQKALSARYDAVVLDLPGFGGSQMPLGTWGLDDYVTFAQHFMQKIGAAEPYALIGHSNGGAMAIRAIALGLIHPGKLVLLAAAGIRGTDKSRNFGLKLLAKTGKIAAKPLPKSVQRKLRANLYKAAGSDMLVAEHMQETFKRIVSQDVRSDAEKVSVPALLVYGSDDTDTPPSYGEMYSGLIDGSRLEIMPGAGHFLHTENTDIVVAKIGEFLR